MDSQFLNIVAFAGFAGFVAGVVLTWIIARTVLFGRSNGVREHVGTRGIAQLKRLADHQSRQAQTLVEANKLAQSASADLAKAAELLRQAEGEFRSSTEQLGSLAAGSGEAYAVMDGEPLKPRAARA
jgi:phage-related minor tail protein